MIKFFNLYRPHAVAHMFQQLFAIALCVLGSMSSVHAGLLEDSQGRWLAKLEVDGRVVQSGLELFKRADGQFGGEMIAIDRGFAASRLGHVIVNNENVEIDGPRGVHLSLKLIQGNLTGSLQQGPRNFPIQFVKVEGFGEPLKVQTPRAPFLYQVEELVFRSADGTMLAGSLTLPSSKATYKAVVLIHGTGPQDRNQNEEGHQNFAVIADHLTRNGIAVLRFDKRGVKRSGGNYETHTHDDLVADVNAAVSFLRERKNVTNVGILGHSEGAELAARVAAQSFQPVDFLLSLSGPGQALMTVLDYENSSGVKLAGASDKEVEVVSRIGQQFMQIIQSNPDPKIRMAALQAMMQASAKEERDVLAKYRAQLPVLNPAVAATPWAFSAMNSRPQDEWRKVKVPVLILHGDKDMQISARDNVAAISAALQQAGNRFVKVDMLPGLNHNLQTATTGGQDEYSRIAETIAPQVLQKISIFIKTLP